MRIETESVIAYPIHFQLKEKKRENYSQPTRFDISRSHATLFPSV